MLVLSRRVGEQIVIRDNIVVTVVSVKGNQVRLGFDAPAEVSIYREELVPQGAKTAGQQKATPNQSKT